MTEDPGEQFGQERPPLHVSIKQILERYPDGQIFKELIQNADDAGASKVQFYVDCRQRNTPASKLAMEDYIYSGPALFSANNAKFSEEDWKGIQRLQQSIKAKDPFKVGRFGIGFNSVYHLTDIPTIISGKRIAYLEPQEELWRHQSGRAFELAEVITKDAAKLKPFDKIANFSSQTRCYNETLFRFPLRTAASKLSENLYTVEKVKELIEALKLEAELLLLFLRSVHSIEVYNIDDHGMQTLSFMVSIAESFVEDVKRKRVSLLADLKSRDSSHCIIKFSAKFNIHVCNCLAERSISQWLVVQQVGSSNERVREASDKQKVFPWVGTAVRLDNPGNGRVFCFLPMPIEATTGLPVHINGTFGLNDDRRSLKWPGIERKNDPAADWNQILVSEVIPSCYVSLLFECKSLLSSSDFYKIWPDVSSLKNSQWEPLLKKVLTAILCNDSEVIFSEFCKRQGEWVKPSTAVFIPNKLKTDNATLLPVVQQVLSSCGVKLAEAPFSVRNAFAFVEVLMKEATPELTRHHIRQQADSYANIDTSDKLLLLKYCLLDGKCDDIYGLKLLPLCDGTFQIFQMKSTNRDCFHYLCTHECQRDLLPNMDHKLVDPADHPGLESDLEMVAKSNATHLKVLEVSDVAALINESMPWEWQSRSKVSFPNSRLPSDWFKIFWSWVQDKQLSLFADKIILPVFKQDVSVSAGHFNVVRLTASPILYVPKPIPCSELDLTVLGKFKLFCCPQKFEDFCFVAHKDLDQYTDILDSTTILKAIASDSTHHRVVFASCEAACLRKLLCGTNTGEGLSEYCDVLRHLKIFTSACNTQNQLYSVEDACQQSLLKTSVILDEASSKLFDVSVLPNNIILFASSDHEQYQKQLLQFVASDSFLNMSQFLNKHVFPHMKDWNIPDKYFDPIMNAVFKNFENLNRDGNIQSSLQNLSFVTTSSGVRRSPQDLYDPDIPELCRILFNESLFPAAPYNEPQLLSSLRTCGLQKSITPQKILDTIRSICLPCDSTPQSVEREKLICAKTILQYIGHENFKQNFGVKCSLPPERMGDGSKTFSFSEALSHLCHNKSWLPVLASRPKGYPSQLPWKGEKFPNHLCTLNSDVSVSTSSLPLQPLKYGSQVYFTDPVIDSDVRLSQESPSHLVSHLQLVVDNAEGISQSKMCEIMHAMYSTMLDIVSQGNEDELSSLESIDKWIYVDRDDKFVSPTTVAVELNSSFRHILEPYLYKLPDSISKYHELFEAFGVNKVMSQEQIMSVLPAMRSSIENQATSMISVKECWNIVMDILNWLTNNGTKSFSGSLDPIYVPVESESEWPDLRAAEEVVYTDNEFFKKFLETEESLLFVHSCISTNIAECLQLTPLSKKLDIATDTFEDAGQFEPLTTRLKNILRDYKDGLTIVKELIQNADDAEATEVNVLFDARTHHITSDELFFPGMAESHGPALVIHNNKVFSDEDFANITKLAGATKQSKHLKIGKFGVGFCSVYHITDIPSFLSRDRLYIFDPTMNYLRKEIKNPAQPGKRLQFTSRVIRNSRQLDPYKNLYQFSQSEVYNGTIFRLPFRTACSELSGKCYSEKDAFKLLEDIHSSGESLILFLQHVHSITCQHIKDGQTEPTTLFSVHKKNSSPLKQEGVLGISIDSAEGKKSSSSSKWLVSQQCNNDTKYAVASVACKLKSGRYPESYHVCKELNGEIFCYLPLAQSTGLPVHVSCNFAVINNRRGIWTAEESHSTTNEPEVKWNNFLMETVVPEAYLKLLYALKDMHASNSLEGYNFHDLWPLSENLKQQNPWSIFITELYSNLSFSDNDLFYTESLGEWISIDKGKLLKSDIFCTSITANRAQIVELLVHLKLPLVDLPLEYQHTKYFDFSDCLIDQFGFIELFFSNLRSFSDVYERRNAMIQSLLEVYALERDHSSDLGKVLQKKLADHACIPCSPQGEILKKCEKLIDPKAKFANLYDASDCMFVLEELVEKDLPQMALKKLGMISDSIPWEYVLERARTVQLVLQSNPLKAYKRVQYTLAAITSYTNGTSPSELPSLDFLPVMKKPSDFNLEWPGDGMTFSSGNKMMLSGQESEHVMIAGSQSIFVCENDPEHDGCGPISVKARKALGLKGAPSIVAVVDHFKLVISTWQTGKQSLSSDWVKKVCRLIYAYLEKCLKEQSEENVIRKLRDLPCIWTGSSFIHTNEICFEWTRPGPYLYKVPVILSGKKKLCAALSIKKVFSLEDIKNALSKMKADYEEKPISSDCQSVIIMIIPLLHDMEEETLKDSCLLLPDEDYCLHSSKDLAYNDVPWMSENATHIKFYVNPIIPRELATRLGVLPVRTKFLERYSTHGFRRFGQKEDLTRRIQNILRDYPLDVTLLKELLQNADDAKATKMYVILDKRFHAAKSILSDEWKDLQGPAMLVWNDSVFSEEDLEGIQELGLGSKRSEADTIGQYGIGFNVVYHITDCPSFISNDETLCIMDPHCRYVPGADECSPGARFDRLNEGLWQNFPDMQSPYLRKGLSVASGEVNFKSGSLFRFPIRHDKREISSSKIVDNIDNLVSSLSGAELEKLLKKWMRKMKHAMLFLNNVTELKLLIIEKNSSKMNTVFHFTSKTGESALTDQKEMLQRAISSFKPGGSCEPHTITYPLLLSEVISSGQKSQEVEKWLIQQGMGNTYNKGCTWDYIKSMKPRHGIAAPLSMLKSSTFRGQVFCFLPLPVYSDLPVHVNGHFILDSNRRGLWTNDVEDSRSKWNNHLIKALASSYAEFLVNSRKYCISKDVYNSIHTAIHEMLQYYKLFPIFKTQNNQWKILSQEVYRIILERNLPVFCVIQLGDKGCSIEWLSAPLSGSSMRPIYYWPSNNYTEGKHSKVYPILERIGMKITPAPSDVMNCCNESNGKFFQVTRRTVFDHYTKFTSADTMKPTVIEETVFKSVDCYLIFTNYILAKISQQEHNLVPSLSYIYKAKQEQCREYPNSPFNHYLLLTADKILRKFVESSKVLASDFSNLFPNSLSSFLHPALLNICYKETYLMQPDDDSAENLVLQIIKANLPQQMRAVQIPASVISRDHLQSLWKCFKCDQVFHKHLSVVLKEWALLLSQNNMLFSSVSQILPVNEATRCSCRQSSMLKVLKAIKTPFLDTTVVVVNVGCPTIADGVRILSNLYYSDKESPISKLLSKKQLNVVIYYLKQEVIAQSAPLSDEQGIIQQVRSLPLFENIDGDYISLNDKNPYVWPENACEIGYKKWLEGLRAVFIKPDAKWSQLGSAQILSVEKITTAKLYVDFIFPNFDKMNSEEKFQHLEFIRDRLYCNIERAIEMISFTWEECTRHSEAVSFLSALKELHCILGCDGSFYKIADFCDHTIEIFETFPKSFKFLPHDYKKDSDKWLPFFRGLGLRRSVSQKEFLKFCHDTASHKVSNLKSCSNVLLEYLFSQHAWQDATNFCQQVSEISFVLQEELPELNWLARSFVSAGELVKLKNSAPLDQATLLWTQKPIVDFPSSLTPIFEGMLGIIRNPSPADVIANIKNICEKSQYAKQELFTKYPGHLINKGNLLQIMAVNLKYLLGSGADFDCLKLLPCIPVHNTTEPQASDRNFVLVKPCEVVHEQWNKTEVIQFHPFLHCLPDLEMLQSTSKLLLQIGVKASLDLRHIQIVLEGAYKASKDNSLDPNTERCVQLAINLLADKFLKNLDSTTGDVLSPLYLPDTKNVLKCSKNLLYGDTINYWKKIKLDLTNLQGHYSHFDIKIGDYHIQAATFCKMLPESVRPIGLSSLCKQVVPDTCKEAKTSSVAEQLQKMIKIEELPTGIVRFLRKFIGTKDDENDLKKLITTYFNKIKVMTIADLKVEIRLKEGNKFLGTLNTKFCFVPSDVKSMLYLDSSLCYPVHNDGVYSDIATDLCKYLRNVMKSEMTGVEQESKVIEFIKTCLKVSSLNDLAEILSEEYDINVDDQMRGFKKRIGELIPNCWHHRLEQDMDNVFNPMEYVGYENEDGKLIVAQIVHPVASSIEEHSYLVKKYRIYVKEDDEEGIEVSILSLYKFIIGQKKTDQSATTSEEKDVVLFDDDAELPKLRSKLIEEDLVKIMKEICNVLREIWKLPEELKKKAVRRLFLKWHPDKNDNKDVAEKIFKFLMKQIEHLEKGEPHDDPTATQTFSTSRSSGGGHRYRRQDYYYSSWFNFNSWEDTAQRHSRASHFEYSYFYGGGGGGYQSFYPFFKTRHEKNPGEGKRWLLQAKGEFEILTALHGQLGTCPGHSYVCFIAHQVAEKALKGGVYTLCGLDGRSLIDHNLSRHALALEDAKPSQTKGLAQHAAGLNDYYLKTRYPNKWPGDPNTPLEHYTQMDADGAKKNAKFILDTVLAIIPT